MIKEHLEELYSEQSEYIVLPERIREIVKFIKEHLDGSVRVILFGSRARGENKGFRDFDLAILQKKPISWREFALLKNEVEELAWPYKVDLIDIDRAPVGFKEIIESEGIVLNETPVIKGVNMSEKREKDSLSSAHESLDALTKSIEWLDADSTAPDRWGRLDAVAKRFEVSFEYVWKAIKVALEREGEEVYGPKDTIQKAGLYQWIEDIEDWIEFLQARNVGVHDYFGLSSEEYAEIARRFEKSARLTLSRLPYNKKNL